MSIQTPEYLTIGPKQLGVGVSAKVRVCGGMADIAQDMAERFLDVFEQVRNDGRNATFIMPVGPVDQFPIMAKMINERRLDCRDVMLINMDEYLTDDDQWVDIDHPLGFRGYMNRLFYDLVDVKLVPRPENRVFPDPKNPDAIGELIKERGGVDACFGGIGINGHIAFNEPPEPGEIVSVEQFAARPTRVLSLSRETRTINSVTVGGEISIIPHRAVTVGMKEILASKKVLFYCNRPWQGAVVRRVLHAPVTSACPASLLQTHSDFVLTVAEYVADIPDIKLR